MPNRENQDEPEQHDPRQAGGLGTGVPAAGSTEAQRDDTTVGDTGVTGASGVDGPSAQDGTYGDIGRDTAGSLDGTPDETS